MQEPTVPHDGVFKISPPSEKRNLNQHLSWDDLVFVSSKSWGLRNAKSIANTQKEKTKGFFGDALAISAVHNLLNDEEFFKVAEPSKYIHTDNSVYEYNMVPKNSAFDEAHRIERLRLYLKSHAITNLPVNMQNILLERFETAIHAFIRESLRQNIWLSGSDNTTQSLQEYLKKNGFGFILGEFSGGGIGEDPKEYYGLGKCGAGRIKPGKVVDAITSNGHIQDSLVQSQQETFLDDLSESFFQEIVTSIQRQKKA